MNTSRIEGAEHWVEKGFVGSHENQAWPWSQRGAPDQRATLELATCHGHNVAVLASGIYPPASLGGLKKGFLDLVSVAECHTSLYGLHPGLQTAHNHILSPLEASLFLIFSSDREAKLLETLLE